MCRNEIRFASLPCGKCATSVQAKAMATASIRLKPAASMTHRTYKIKYCQSCFEKMEAGLAKAANSQKLILEELMNARVMKVKMARKEKKRAELESLKSESLFDLIDKK